MMKRDPNPHPDALRPDADRLPGDPPFKSLRYCSRCCMPETSERIGFDEMGICHACRSSEQKMRINWNERQEKTAHHS